MTFVITAGCCNDSSCIPVCPVQCIRPRPGDPDFATAEQLYIDPATCIDCGVCMDECPVDAIYAEWDLPEHLREYQEINAGYFETNPIEESSPPDPIRRRLPTDRQELVVAIVGTGPAGCYAAAELSEIKGVTVSLFERLPTPFGLVRSGVAPDHGNTKLIAKRFGGVLSRANVHCYFNVEVGRDVTLQELLEHHHAVIWAGGANDDRRLGLAGEDLSGCVSAREFVAWYNGHPDFADREFDLSGDRAVIIGNGNVALDVARILARPPAELAGTDIADHALEALGASTIHEVLVAGRRGPQYAAYTAGELAMLDQVDSVSLLAATEEIEAISASSDRSAVILRAGAERRPSGAVDRSIVFRFDVQPVSLNGSDAVDSITFSRADGTTETVETSLVVRAVGYRGAPVAGLPFDEVTGTLSHTAGSVCEPDTGEAVVGVYCSGWIKRGATGMIGANKIDSAETVDAILRDFALGRLPDPVRDQAHLAKLIRTRQPDMVDTEGWKLIDQAERAAGRETGRPRRKIVTLSELLAASGLNG